MVRKKKGDARAFGNAVVIPREVDVQRSTCKACGQWEFIDRMVWGRTPPMVGMHHPRCLKEK